jgi:hypothetical protein
MIRRAPEKKSRFTGRFAAKRRYAKSRYIVGLIEMPTGLPSAEPEMLNTHINDRNTRMG